MMPRRSPAVVVVAAFMAAVVSLVAACGREPAGERSAPPAPTAAAPQGLDAARVARGAQVYRAHCAECHGANAAGAPNWQKPGPDGKYPPPPLDGSAHAWHHPMAVLEATIRNGTLRLGGSMPAWRDRLGDDDIEAVIVWFQSLWPPELYQAWRRMDEQARRGS